jgi:hypothetical protein
MAPTLISNAATSPLQHFAVALRQASPELCRNKRLDKRLEEALTDITPFPVGDIGESMPLADQGNFVLAYHQERAALDSAGYPRMGKRGGRPLAGEGVDWSEVDWSKSDTEIANDMGVSPQAVWQHRQKRSGNV